MIYCRKFYTTYADWTLIVMLKHELLGITFPGMMAEKSYGEMIAAALGHPSVKGRDFTRAEAALHRALTGTPLPKAGSRSKLYSETFGHATEVMFGAAAVLGNTGVYNEFVLCPDFPHEIHHFTGTGKQLVEHIRTVGVK